MHQISSEYLLFGSQACGKFFAEICFEYVIYLSGVGRGRPSPNES